MIATSILLRMFVYLISTSLVLWLPYRAEAQKTEYSQPSMVDPWSLPDPGATKGWKSFYMQPGLVPSPMALPIIQPGAISPYDRWITEKTPAGYDIKNWNWWSIHSIGIPKSHVGFYNAGDKALFFEVRISGKPEVVELGINEVITIACGECKAAMKASVQTPSTKREVNLEAGILFLIEGNSGAWDFRKAAGEQQQKK